MGGGALAFRVCVCRSVTTDDEKGRVLWADKERGMVSFLSLPPLHPSKETDC